MSKISIIIPVYNACETIEKCIDSIINQTYQDYEIILINDGSKDKSLEILKEYEKKYPTKIVVVDQENMGVSNTRNKGIKLAKSKYIMFVDNDDYLDNDYLNHYIKEIEKYDLDMVSGGYRRITEDNKIIENRYPKNNEWGRFLIITPWAKIYKKDFLIKNDIKFLNYGIGEDVYFYLQILSHTDKIKMIPYIGYNWFYNTKSVSNTSHKGFNKKIDILYLIKEIDKKISYDYLLSKDIIDYYYIRLILWYLLYSGRSATVKDFKKNYNYLISYLEKNIPNYRKIIFRKMPKEEMLKFKLIIKTFVIIQKLHLVNLFSKIYCKGE
jgi:glycosyltransferase involved in cell wall biosynthesis